MRRLPTDFQILDSIYRRYYKKFTEYSSQSESRSTKIFIPIDINRLANDMGVDGDIIFGRLYYHLENKYSYSRPDGTNVQFFVLGIGNDPHCINFPYLVSVLASLRDENKKYLIAVTVSVVSIVISILAFLSRFLTRVSLNELTSLLTVYVDFLTAMFR